MMISMRLSVIIMLVAFASGARSEGAAGPCAWVRASSLVVPLGSPVTATCEVSEGCHLFSQRDLHLDWQLENRLIPDGVVATESGRLSRIVIPNFNYTRAFLVCLARGSPSQVVGGVQIRAGCISTHGSTEHQLSDEPELTQHVGLSLGPQPAGDPPGHQILPPHGDRGFRPEPHLRAAARGPPLQHSPFRLCLFL